MHPFNWPLRHLQRFNHKKNLNSNRNYVPVGTLTSSSARTQSIAHLHVQDGITY